MKLSFFTILTLFGLSTFAQTKISFTIPQLADSTVNLVRYQGVKMYYADTAKADKNGNFVFDNSWVQKPGMYMLMTKGQKTMEVIVNNENFHLTTDYNNMVGARKFKNSVENTAFYAYIDFLSPRMKKKGELDAALSKTEDDAEKEKIKKDLSALDKEVKEYQASMVEKHKGTLFSEIIKLNMEVPLPDAPKDAEDEKIWLRNYYVSHYWDNVNLRNDANARMAGYQKKLDYLFDNVLVKNPDSLIDYADRLIAKLDPKSEMFKLTVVNLTSKYQNHKIMCLDAVFVHLALKYYKGGFAWWMNAESNKKLIERAEAMAPNICGESIHNIKLKDTADNWPALYDINAEYTILIFWAADCGHCKKEVPQIKKAYDEWKVDGINVEVYAVASKTDKDWYKFITENKLTWINVGVPEKIYSDQGYVNEVVRSGKSDLKSLNYHDTFDIYKTPTIYVLDKDKKIIGKNLESEGLDKYLRQLNDKEKEG